MNSKTNIQELKGLIQQFCENRDWDQYHNAKDLEIGIITEFCKERSIEYHIKEKMPNCAKRINKIFNPKKAN